MKNKGFTVIEFMIVVAIVGILIAIAIPNINRMTNKSNLVCSDEMTAWLRECAKYSGVNDCKYKAEVLFCRRENK